MENVTERKTKKTQRRRLFGLWYGGSNYAAPYVEDDTEEFSSLAEAKRVFQSRYDNDWYPATPCVSDESEMHLFYGDPRDSDDPCPDIVLCFGPRGGVRIW
jgi:hypothetical protein